MKKWAVTFMALSTVVLSGVGDACDIRGHWRLDDGTGMQISDDSGNGNIGFSKGAEWERGVRNSCLLFSGGDGFVNCGNDSSLSPADALTVEAWVKPWNLPYKSFPTVVTKKGSYEFRFAPGGKLSILLTLDGKAVELTSNRTEWKNGVWIYVAATYDGETITLYTDGAKDSELKASGKIDKSRSYCFIGSVNGETRTIGRMDEVRVAGKALSADQINASYNEGAFDMVREATEFSAYFEKENKREPKAAVPGFLWIDAEDFDDYGGWWMDTQFVPQMGSPYLIAAGIGKPVADATTTINVPKSGKWRLWVRTKNWLKSHSPGQFKVSVGGKESEKVFGTAPSDEWAWQLGGTFDLEKGEAALAISDETGWYGRIDAIILAKDMQYAPPEGLLAYKSERARLTGDDTTVDEMGNYDVIVVGAGVAGINAAIASARTGAKTALIQDRPMIGGNNSLELGVVVSGPAQHNHPNSRESGLNEEIGRERAYHYHGKWSRGAENIVANEPNLSVFLNTHVNEVEKKGSTITAVKAFNMVDGKRTRYTAKQFIDCTGDGWLGYYAGAEYRLGREARTEFNESNAPEQPDNITMSGCLMQGHTLCYNTTKMDAPQPFNGPEWLWDLTPNTEYIEARKMFDGSHTYGRWWHENRGDVDDLWDPENARDELIVLNLSYFNWVKKHSSLKEKAENYVMTTLPIGNAKRETRRLMGDHILTQDEVLSAKPFADRIAHGGWSLDIHNPEGIFSKDGPFDFNTHSPLNHIPFRILYSKNVDNLLFAGRNVSTTHVALGTVRVQGTTGVVGQAAGTAAAMCVDKKVNPRGLYQKHMTELQQRLLKDDQYIIGLKNEDSKDLALKAKVTASSFQTGGEPENVISGVTRIVGDAKNMWISDSAKSMPQWIELDFQALEKVNAVYLTFDTDLNDKRHCSWEHKENERFVPESVRNYRIEIFDGKDWATVAEVDNNYQRRRIHRFPKEKASKVRVTVEQTNGDSSARIFEVRAYNE
ncbi:FAD-dependent oxidoreductase [Pontiella sulfatireligans]|nr:FAD-dependent oxidoreductase [Pontiella sulfatireligans]